MSWFEDLEDWLWDPFGVKKEAGRIGRETATGAIEKVKSELLPEIKSIMGELKGYLNQVEGIMKHLFPTGDVIPTFFTQLNGAVNTVGAIASGLIWQAGAVTFVVGAGLSIVDGVTKNILIDKIDRKYKENLTLTFKEINQARTKAISDLRALTGEIDAALENRIDQISLLVTEALTQVVQIAVQFTPDAYMTKLVEPTFKKLNEFESQLFDDLDRRIDRIFAEAESFRERVDEMLMGSIAEIRNDFFKRRQVYAMPNLLDKCRQNLNIASKPGAALTDIELYRLMECHELAKLNETTPIQRIIETYGQLQLNAIRMAAIARKAPALRKQAIKDWVKYGMLCEFWENVEKSYSLLA